MSYNITILFIASTEEAREKAALGNLRCRHNHGLWRPWQIGVPPGRVHSCLVALGIVQLVVRDVVQREHVWCHPDALGSRRHGSQ